MLKPSRMYCLRVVLMAVWVGLRPLTGRATGQPEHAHRILNSKARWGLEKPAPKSDCAGIAGGEPTTPAQVGSCVWEELRFYRVPTVLIGTPKRGLVPRRSRLPLD
jgi:hypothetical protein